MLNTIAMDERIFVTTSIRLEKHLHDAVKKLAREELRTINAEINHLLLHAVRQHNEKYEYKDEENE